MKTGYNSSSGTQRPILPVWSVAHTRPYTCPRATPTVVVCRFSPCNRHDTTRSERGHGFGADHQTLLD
jgi:hypothetical protein